MTILFLPVLAFAHQPRLTTTTFTQVVDPEISKAYYGASLSEPHVYKISSANPFDLYVNILVPDIAGQDKDVSFNIIKTGNPTPIFTGDAEKSEWKKLSEPFGHDKYWQGPEYKAKADAGEYTVTVWSKNPASHYSLAIGEIESFDFKETVNTINLIPTIKKTVFNKNPIDFILSPIGAGYVLIMYILAFIFGFIYRFVVKKVTDKKLKRDVVSGAPIKPSRNIGFKDRLARAVIGLALLLWAITTNWSPILIFFSGFAFFEAIFSWCAFYSAIGKNTCE